MKDRAILAVAEKTPDDGSEPAPRHSRVDEEFALLMTMCARVDCAPAPVVRLETTATAQSSRPSPGVTLARPAEIWRPVDSAVTTAAAVTASSPAERTSLVSEVVHAELGPMRITVEREDGAVRVVFEVADTVARVAVETQRASLLSSMYGAGIKVASVVVAVRSGGTAFAQRSLTTKTKRAKSDSAPDVGNEASSALDVVG